MTQLKSKQTGKRLEHRFIKEDIRVSDRQGKDAQHQWMLEKYKFITGCQCTPTDMAKKVKKLMAANEAWRERGGKAQTLLVQLHGGSRSFLQGYAGVSHRLRQSCRRIFTPVKWKPMHHGYSTCMRNCQKPEKTHLFPPWNGRTYRGASIDKNANSTIKRRQPWLWATTWMELQLGTPRGKNPEAKGLMTRPDVWLHLCDILEKAELQGWRTDQQSDQDKGSTKDVTKNK